MKRLFKILQCRNESTETNYLYHGHRNGKYIAETITACQGFGSTGQMIQLKNLM
jgi:hypothetical protein